jgi:hypothetical protein
LNCSTGRDLAVVEAAIVDEAFETLGLNWHARAPDRNQQMVSVTLGIAR